MMKTNVAVKDELLTMLSEICGQLDELERLLEKNAARSRKELFNKQAEQMNSCYKVMNDLEDEIDITQSNQGKFEKQTNLKLELGY
jgi:K+-sensing histidine kinase KdpD